MRMRKKKYLTERLDAVKSLILDTDLEERDFEKAIQTKDYFDFEEMFGNGNPVHLEIGCGKGQFVCEMAKRCPDINFIAVEKERNVIVAAVEKVENAGLTNVRFIAGCAEYLPRFIPEHSIERIYLNFSCPYPKEKYKKHRLTHRFIHNSRTFFICMIVHGAVFINTVSCGGFHRIHIRSDE